MTAFRIADSVWVKIAEKITAGGGVLDHESRLRREIEWAVELVRSGPAAEEAACHRDFIVEKVASNARALLSSLIELEGFCGDNVRRQVEFGDLLGFDEITFLGGDENLAVINEKLNSLQACLESLAVSSVGRDPTKSRGQPKDLDTRIVCTTIAFNFVHFGRMPSRCENNRTSPHLIDIATIVLDEALGRFRRNNRDAAKRGLRDAIRKCELNRMLGSER